MKPSNDILEGMKQALEKKDIHWIIDHLGNIERMLAQKEYERIKLLVETEKREIWKEHPKYRDASWPEFLKAVCPGLGNEMYQRCKRFLLSFGDEAYKTIGPSRLNVVARYRGNEQKVLEEVMAYVRKNGRVPTPTTIDAIAEKLTGKKRPNLAEVIDGTDIWKERFLQAQVELRKLRKENKALRDDMRVLKEENRILNEYIRKNSVGKVWGPVFKKKEGKWLPV